MHVAVEVSAGDPKEGAYTKTTQCIIVFVAVDDGGTPVRGGTLGAGIRSKTLP